MLPNKIAASILVGLLVAQVFAMSASAQLPEVRGPDLIVEDIDIGRPRVADVQGRINITVRNQGDANFIGTTGWQIFVGLNGGTDSFCIERGDGVSNTVGGSVTATSPCYIRMAPGQPQPADGSNATNIPAGESRRYTLMWNASTTDVSETAKVYAEIGPLGSQPGGNLEEDCPGPDQPNCANNRFILHGVNIGRLGVRAVAQRDIAPGGDDPNDAWRRADVNEACPLSPEVVQRGCKVPAGKTIVASYLVKNVGTVDDSYTPRLLVSNYYAERGYVFAFAPHNFSLGKAQQREVKLTIVVPENETATNPGQSNNATNIDFVTERIRWSSTRAGHIATDTPTNPGCDVEQNRPDCVNPTLPSFVVDYRRGLNATSNETWRQASATKPAYLNITLNNTGNAEDTYNITILRDTWTINDSWVPTVGGPGVSNVVQGKNTPTTGFITLKKDELRNVTLQVTPPANATNGTYTFLVAMKSVGDLDGNARCKSNEVLGQGVCTQRFTVHLGQEWQITGASDVPARVVPGEPVTYNLGIRNDGNGYDNVSLELATTHFGWDVRLSDNVARLTPFNTTTFTLTVTSPPNVPENTIAAFFVNATAGGPQETPFESRSKASIESVMTILRGPNIRLDVPTNSSFVDAGDSANYTLLVTNVGNVADNFTIPTPQRPSDWGVDVEPGYLELQPNQQGQVRVALRAPSGATVGEKANAIVKVLSTVDTSREKSTTLEGRISGPDLFVDSVLVNSTNPYTGDPVEVSVVLGNSGNKAADKNVTLRVYFVQDGVERVVGEKLYPPLSIPGQRRLVEVFPWNTEGVEGAGVLLARIDVDDAVPEIDDSATSNEKTKALTLRTFDIKLTPAQGLTARPSEKITYGEAPNVFVVRYDGNQASEPVTIRFESEHGWLSSQSELTLALPRGTPIPVIASLDVPTIPGTGKDTLTITVTPALRPAEALRATTTTTIIDEENPRVTRIVATPATTKLGEKVTIDVHVEDATGVSSVTAYVVLPTNETQSMVLSKAAEGRWNGTKTFTVAGAYRVTAEAADAADPPNLNRTRLTSGSFVITPGSAPTVKLAADQGTTIRTGTPIKLDISDPLGVGKVTYSIRGVVYDLRGPGFQIDTSTFAAGPIDIIVDAENIYGVSTSQKFAFTVDNTPPGINKVTMRPERPAANEEVTLTIATDPNVAGVEVLVKRDGQVVQSVNATRKGAGTFEVKFDTPEGAYRIDVTARDGAGNIKLAESAVVFSAKPASFIPGPSLLLVLAGLVGLALVARRRR